MIKLLIKSLRATATFAFGLATSVEHLLIKAAQLFIAVHGRLCGLNQQVTEQS